MKPGRHNGKPFIYIKTKFWSVTDEGFAKTASWLKTFSLVPTWTKVIRNASYVFPRSTAYFRQDSSKDSVTFRLHASTKRRQRLYIYTKTRLRGSWTGITQQDRSNPKLDVEHPCWCADLGHKWYQTGSTIL